MSNSTEPSPWFKIFALMVVGGVAKALFAPQWRPVGPVITKGVTEGFQKSIDAAKDVK